MSIPVAVQGASVSATHPTAGTSYTYTGTVTLGSPATAGNIILVYVQSISNFTGTLVTTVVDSAGNTYTKILGPSISGLEGGAHWLYSCNSITGAPTTVTVTFVFTQVVPTSSYSQIAVMEVSGARATTPIFGTNFNNGVSVTAGTIWTFSNFLTNFANTLVICVGGSIVDNAIHGISAGSGCTQIVQNNDAVNGMVCLAEYQNAPTVNHYNMTMTFGGSTSLDGAGYSLGVVGTPSASPFTQGFLVGF